REQDRQLGSDLLAKLTDGKLHLSVSSKTEAFFPKITGVETHQFSGPHPAGNVGVQIHHIDRLLAGEIIWYISPRHVAQIGSFLSKGEYPASKTYALTGSELDNQHYIQATEGALVSDLVNTPLAVNKQRVISGNVLTGQQTNAAGYIGFYDDMLTVIPELTGRRFMGWVQLGFKASSFWRMFLSKLTPRNKQAPTTDMNGEERAFVSTGEYEKVLPIDVLPVHLCKAILVEDIELMEQPVPAHDFEGLRYVRENVSMPVYADESIFSPHDALTLVSMNAVDGLNIKLMKCGGIYNALKIVAIAETAGIPCMIGSMMESHISVAAAAHLAASRTVIKRYDLDAPLFCSFNPAVGGISYQGSKVCFSDAPGLGIESIG
ncbi:MAG: hypothetical protein L3J79_09970, partial [Candidatus Marinimicrobia bacterium]|nr:hypothetical protein [Candidatus Neomarinimicrobiota bacterium]